MANDRNDAAGYLGWFFLGGMLGAAAVRQQNLVREDSKQDPESGR